MQNHRNGRVLQFGAFELKTDTGEMRKHGTKIRLQGKPLQLLQALLDHPGDVVTREELRDKLWAVDTFVDFESGLNTAVNRLRLALGDSAERPRYVETLARSGYRFVAPVNVNIVPATEDGEAPATPTAPSNGTVVVEPPPAPPAPSMRAWLAGGVAAGLLVVAILILAMRPKPAPQPVFHQISFGRTTIHAARFGPDGQSVIYEARSVPGDRELYLANTVSPESRPLGFPQTSLAAVSRSGELALSTLGGPAASRNLARVPMNGGAPLPLDRGVFAADWAPDGTRMAVIRFGIRPGALEYPRGKTIYESAGWLSDVRVSPSGSEVAFIDHPLRGDDAGSIAVVDTRGAKRVLSADWASADGLAWSPSGNEVWFTAARTGLTRALYAVSLSGKLRPVAAFPGTLMLCDISAAGRVLVSREQMRVMMTGQRDGEPKEKDLSWFDYTNVEDISADGRVVLFGETGEGGGVHHAVYIRRAGAASAVHVSEGFPMAISPDGNWVLSRPDGDQGSLNLVPLSPGEPRAISGHGLKYDVARFFPSGDRILVGGSMAGRPPRLYIQNLDGSAPEPLRSGVYLSHPAISEDGALLAGVDGDQRLLVLPAAGGEPKVVETGLAPMLVLSVNHAHNSVLAQMDSIPAMIYRIDLDTGHHKLWKEVAPFDLAGVSTIWPAVIARDEHTVVYSFLRDLSELFVVDGWR